jgi:hypothetical protein
MKELREWFVNHIENLHEQLRSCSTSESKRIHSEIDEAWRMYIIASKYIDTASDKNNYSLPTM